MIEIKNRYSTETIYKYDDADLSYADLSYADLSYADLSYADLSYADLSGAYLSYADLSEANLCYANLSDANLSSADLRNANLRNADLSGADLRNADLSSADLSGADLSDADLSGADLRNVILPDGRSLQEYNDWLPSGLLTQGGKPLSEVVAAWDKHTWQDCPMHCAFEVVGISEIPDCWRNAAATFVALFDGGHLPKPVVAS